MTNKGQKVKIFVLKDRCKGCGICVAVCQTEVLKLSDEKNKDGQRHPVVIDEEQCLNCGLCEMFCPDFAIWTTKEKEEVLG
ncbi:MAG: 4Fe-4S dicluster domain-containing protein [Candidatus Aminicenantes bacterium]|nr:4Fe-4S dicluster domain-containing protein [Candidatus Aminicenantes bacterium]